MKNFFIYFLSILAIPALCCVTLLLVGATNGDAESPLRFAEIRHMDGKCTTVIVDRVSERRTGMLFIVTSDGTTFEVSKLNVLLKSNAN